MPLTQSRGQNFLARNRFLHVTQLGIPRCDMLMERRTEEHSVEKRGWHVASRSFGSAEGNVP